MVYGGENNQWALVACWLVDDGRFLMEPPGHRDSTTPWLRCILDAQKSAESQLDRWGARGRSQAARTLERRMVRPGARSRERSDSKGQPEAQRRETNLAQGANAKVEGAKRRSQSMVRCLVPRSHPADRREASARVLDAGEFQERTAMLGIRRLEPRSTSSNGGKLIPSPPTRDGFGPLFRSLAT